ncbi:hypothetical protein SESBI_43172 [Sesbania bispinosa]|nr:hypothetical protein SESBI_43172 [Sesbania bispinosa]
MASRQDQVSHPEMKSIPDSLALDKNPKLIAKKVWNIGRELGVSMYGDESEVLNMLEDMERRDMGVVGRIVVE